MTAREDPRRQQEREEELARKLQNPALRARIVRALSQYVADQIKEDRRLGQLRKVDR